MSTPAERTLPALRLATDGSILIDRYDSERQSRLDGRRSKDLGFRLPSAGLDLGGRGAGWKPAGSRRDGLALYPAFRLPWRVMGRWGAVAGLPGRA